MSKGNSSGIKSEERKGPLWLFILIIFLFLIGMGFYTPSYNEIETHTVIQDMDGLVNAFSSFMVGDLDGFFEGLLDGLVVIAIFMIIYSISHFLFTTIFKKLFTKPQATILSIVISIYLLTNNKIYNYAISLNTFTIALLVFMMLIFMIWGFGKHNVKSYKEKTYLLKELKKDQHLSKDEFLKIKKEYNKLIKENKIN